MTLDPRLVVDDAGELVARALFEGLVDLAPTGGVMPAGAESWRVSEDGTTYRFTLRRATFHDGRPVTADDHAAALLAALDPSRPPFGREGALTGLLGASLPAEDGTAIAGSPDDVLAAGGIEVAGTWELVLRLAEPDPRLLHALTDVAFAPVPPGADDDPATFAARPIGNGPFRLVGSRGDDPFLRLAAVPEHHRAPRVDELLIQFYPDDPSAEQRWSDLVAGRLQVARVPGSRREEAVERFGRAVPTVPGSTTGLHDAALAASYAYAFDTTLPPFDDVRLRRALAAALDREVLAAAVGGGALPAVRLLPPSLLPATSGVAVCPHCRHDPELARGLFDEFLATSGAAVLARVGPDADAPPVLPIVLTVPRRGDHVAIAELVAAQWEALLDVRVTLRTLDPAGLDAAVVAGRAPVFRPALRSGLGGTAAVSSLLDPATRSTASRPEAGTGWGDPTTDLLLDRLRAGRDPGAAVELDAAITGDAALIPLLWFRHDLVVVPGLRGFRLDATGRWWPERVSLD